MNVFLICFINGLFTEYRWLLNEYNKSWNNPLKYSELTPKEVRLIINKYESELHQNKTKKLKFEKVQKVQNILDNRKYLQNQESKLSWALDLTCMTPFNVLPPSSVFQKGLGRCSPESFAAGCRDIGYTGNIDAASQHKSISCCYNGC